MNYILMAQLSIPFPPWQGYQGILEYPYLGGWYLFVKSARNKVEKWILDLGFLPFVDAWLLGRPEENTDWRKRGLTWRSFQEEDWGDDIPKYIYQWWHWWNYSQKEKRWGLGIGNYLPVLCYPLGNNLGQAALPLWGLGLIMALS